MTVNRMLADPWALMWFIMLLQPLVWVLFSLTSLLKISLGYLMLCLVRGDDGRLKE